MTLDLRKFRICCGSSAAFAVIALAIQAAGAFGQPASGGELTPSRESIHTGARPKYDIADAHLHFLNFVQETSGMEALSGVIFEQEVAPGGVLDGRWVSLIGEYPDRFMIGSDAPAMFDQYKLTLHRYYLLPARHAR
jgi:hypothetical protein